MRFEQNSLRTNADVAELTVDDEAMSVITDQNWCSEVDVRRMAQRRFLQQRALRSQCKQFLRKGLTRQRPETCTPASRQDDGMKLSGNLPLRCSRSDYFERVHAVEAMD